MRVDDDGPGIPPEERERLLEPFARGVDAGPNGTGLGLAIVAQQAAIHGGELRLTTPPAAASASRSAPLRPTPSRGSRIDRLTGCEQA